MELHCFFFLTPLLGSLLQTTISWLLPRYGLYSSEASIPFSNSLYYFWGPCSLLFSSLIPSFFLPLSSRSLSSLLIQHCYCHSSLSHYVLSLYFSWSQISFRSCLSFVQPSWTLPLLQWEHACLIPLLFHLSPPSLCRLRTTLLFLKF